MTNTHRHHLMMDAQYETEDEVAVALTPDRVWWHGRVHGDLIEVTQVDGHIKDNLTPNRGGVEQVERVHRTIQPLLAAR